MMVFRLHFEMCSYFLFMQRTLNFYFLTYSLIVVAYKKLFTTSPCDTSGPVAVAVGVDCFGSTKYKTSINTDISTIKWS